MEQSRLYHEGSRRIQDRFDTRRIADRLERVNLRAAFTDADRELVDGASMFFLATVDPDGFPDVSYKGGMPGFVRVTGASELAFPSYDGNGMFKSLGNAVAHPEVGLLFIRWTGKAKKLRVQGRATVADDDPLLERLEGAQLVVRVAAERIWDNCPRYLHRVEVAEHSVYAPRAGHQPPVPDWKRDERYRDALPARDRP